MKKGVLILLCLPMLTLAQQTYVPDDNYKRNNQHNDVPYIHEYKLLDAIFEHTDLGCYAAYTKRLNQGVEWGIYIYGIDEEGIQSDPDLDKKHIYPGIIIKWRGLSTAQLSTIEWRKKYNQVLERLNEKAPGKWSLL